MACSCKTRISVPAISSASARAGEYFSAPRIEGNIDLYKRKERKEDFLFALFAFYAVKTGYSRNFESMIIVTGPSLTRLTSISAPNSPVASGLPKSSCNRCVNFLKRGIAISGFAERM